MYPPPGQLNPSPAPQRYPQGQQNPPMPAGAPNNPVTAVSGGPVRAFGPPPQMHPFGNEVGRRFMGFFSYSL